MPRRFSISQNNVLYSVFAENRNPPSNIVEELSRKTGLTVRQIRGWFSNQRSAEYRANQRAVKNARLSEDQIAALQRKFQERGPMLPPREYAQLGEKLGLSQKQVCAWFANQRKKSSQGSKDESYRPRSVNWDSTLQADLDCPPRLSRASVRQLARDMQLPEDRVLQLVNNQTEPTATSSGVAIEHYSLGQDGSDLTSGELVESVNSFGNDQNTLQYDSDSVMINHISVEENSNKNPVDEQSMTLVSVAATSQKTQMIVNQVTESSVQDLQKQIDQLRYENERMQVMSQMQWYYWMSYYSQCLRPAYLHQLQHQVAEPSARETTSCDFSSLRPMQPLNMGYPSYYPWFYNMPQTYLNSSFNYVNYNPYYQPQLYPSASTCSYSVDQSR